MAATAEAVKERPQADDTAMAEMLENARAATGFLKALANESRLLILCMLAEGERSVTELEGMLELRQPTVSQQLARLRSENLVETRREGKAIYYSLASEEARQVVNLLYDLFCNRDGKAEAICRT